MKDESLITYMIKIALGSTDVPVNPSESNPPNKVPLNRDSDNIK